MERKGERTSPPSLDAAEEKIKQIETWLDQLEKTVAQQNATSTQSNLPQINDDQNAPPPPQPQKPIVLPLTKTEIEVGLHKPITSAIRWLAEWSIRMIKMYHNRVRYPAPAKAYAA